MATTLRSRRKSAQRRKGVAIIFALITIVLATVIILAFFSRAQLNRQISYTSTNEVRVDLFSHSALDIIVGELREEIRNGSTSLNGGNSTYAAIYQPNTTADVVLKQLGTDGTGPAIMANVSANAVGIYPSGRALGSSTSVSTRSINGRYISTATWFGTGGPYLGSQTTLPTWVFATRGNGVKVPTIANAKDPTNADYVIGRFAYTVYDIGGLLNANVAGYPTADSGDASYKSSLGYSDLTQIPGLSSPASFISWRNGTDAASASAYSSYIQNYGVPNGFLTTKLGDNAFLSRRDLLNFSQQSLGIPTTSLGYFTTFARSLNAPCWGPVADATTMGGTGSAYAYKTNANTTGTANRFLPNVRFTAAGTITHYHDDGTTETYAVTAGTPLIQRRFSLAKLAWLGSSGPQNGGSAAAIQACFGLQWENSPVYTSTYSDIVSGGYGWVYTGSTAAVSATPTALGSIETLDQVAAEGREPNFFELLQAGILSGVLGVNNKGYAAGSSPAGTSPNPPGFPSAVQSSSFLHTLTIGANLIDQYKNDSYPTVISGMYNGAADMITGTKALPMINGYMELAGADPAAPSNMADYMSVNLWNPNVLPSNGSAGNVPNIRIHVEGGYTQNDGWASNAGAPTSQPYSTYPLPVPSTPADGTIQISPASYGNYANVAPITQATVNTATISGWGTIPTVTPPGGTAGTIEGFQFPDVLTDISRKSTVATNLAASGDAAIEYLQNYPGTASNPFNIVAEYQPPGTSAWIPYSFLIGINDTVTWRTGQVVHWINNSRINSASTPPVVKPFSATQAQVGPFDYKIDPRSTRFNEEQWSTSATPSITGIPFLQLSDLSVFGLATGTTEQRIPLLFSSSESLSSPTTFSPASLAFNNGSSTYTISSYADLDGVRRIADYGLFTGDTWASTPYGAASSTSQPAANSPIILNRPFRSVGEIGYTFIDLPWRSINFCDHNNAFGGLLDIFALTDEPAVVDDRVNLNAQQSVVMQSLLSGAIQAPDGTLPLTQPGNIATAYNTYAYTSGAPTSTLPITTGQLSDFLYSLGTADGLDDVKAHREAVVRALSGTTQTRTWNVLIDVVAQVGRYGSTAGSLNDFIVEGEKRYWLSAAIDRYTGKVISQNLEPVNE